MRIVNRTHYETEALRALFAAGLRHLEAPSKGKVVHVVYTRPGDGRRADGCAGYVTGEATLGRRVGGTLYHGRYLKMRLPSDPALLDVGAIARVWDHEVRHTLGVRHRSMTEAIRKCVGPTPSWAEGLTIHVKAIVKQGPHERRAAEKAKREAHAREMLARWEKKLTTAKARVKKWSTTVRYYERRASSAPPVSV